MIKFALIMMCCIMTAWITAVSAEIVPRMVISVENTDDHVQTIAVKRYADELKKKLDGRIDIQFHANARLYRDKDVVQALEQGRIEMAVPGTWNVAQFEPNLEIFLLPMFYGRSAQASYRVLDSSAGQHINDRLEKNLKIKVIGRWIDLGHAHIFGISRKINQMEDIKGLKVRVAGGTANKLRIEAFGGLSKIVSWPDLPEYMQRGKVDAILTSYETVLSARLWEKGIRYVFEDREYFPQYIPMVRLSFWNKLTPELQKVLIETWEEHVNTARKEAADAQWKAKGTLIRQGVEIVIPDAQQIAAWRNVLMSQQNLFVKALGIDSEIVGEVTAQLEKEPE